MQADTFDEELKKLVGMGFEKVPQCFIMNTNYIVGLSAIPICLTIESVHNTRCHEPR
jgi:hypothetical protein